MLGANYDIIGKPISDNAVRIVRPSVYTVGLGEKREITTRRPSVASKSAAISVATTYNTPAPPGLFSFCNSSPTMFTVYLSPMDLLSIVHEDLQQASDSEYTSNVYNPTRNYEQYSYYFVGVFF